MNKKWTDPNVNTGRRGFFRQLAMSAIESLEQTGKTLADRTTRGFQQHEPDSYRQGSHDPFIPPDYNNYYHSPYTHFGPPWPPELGPYVDLELRAKLRAEREQAEQQKLAEQGSAVSFDDAGEDEDEDECP